MNITGKFYLGRHSGNYYHIIKKEGTKYLVNFFCRNTVDTRFYDFSIVESTVESELVLIEDEATIASLLLRGL
jgi:hypothetical protein